MLPQFALPTKKTTPPNCNVVPVDGTPSAHTQRRSVAGLSFFTAFLLTLLLAQAGTMGQQPSTEPAPAEPNKSKPLRKAELPFKPGKNWERLTADHEVWIDLKKKQVLVGGTICLREGLLEMFSCPRGTKEHEAIVSANTPARFVHAGLIALGAQPGPPVQFQPTYKPAQGTEVEVTVVWKDLKGEEHRVRAQEWVKQTKTGKALKYPWVFAGSGFWTDERTGEQFYHADGGEFICVSNFSTAMLDLPVESSDANDTLMFCAFTQRIPPRGTRVYLLLTPKLKTTSANKKPASNKKPAKQPADGKATPKKKPAQEPVKVPPKEQSEDKTEA